jgi:4-amino-4-deoxy-L-arabinose transferase-like glycosyltransferase
MTAVKSRRFTVACWIVVAIAAALRMYRLSSWDMWTDEANTYWTAVTGEYVSGPMYASAPINFFLTKLAIRWAGANELGLRIVPFLAGVASIAAAFFVLRRWIGERAALVAAVVLTLSIWHLYWSQTGRHFSLVTLLLLCALHAFLVFWQDGKVAALAGSAVLVLAALFTHSSSGFYLASLLGFAAGHWAIVRWERGWASPWNRDDLRHALALGAFATVLLLYLPIYLKVGAYTLEHRTAWNPPWNIVGSLVFYIPPYLSLTALAGFALLVRERRDLALLLLGWILIPIALVTVASSLTIASGSYCLPSILAVAALAGVAADRLLAASHDAARRWGTGLLLGAVLASLAYDTALYFTYDHGLKPRWAALCRLVESQRAPGEMFLAEEGDVAQFYLGRDKADWLGKYEREVGAGTYPPDGATGVWYGFYLTDSDILRKEDRVLRRVLDNAKLVKLFPLHYGPKDRTLALFHETLPTGAARAPSR